MFVKPKIQQKFLVGANQNGKGNNREEAGMSYNQTFEDTCTISINAPSTRGGLQLIFSTDKKPPSKRWKRYRHKPNGCDH